MARPITKYLHEAFAQNKKIDLDKLAPRLNGKASSTLYNELNPWVEPGEAKGKLSIEDAVEMMIITGNFEPLHRIANHLGFALVPLHERKPVSCNTIHKEFTDVAVSVGSLGERVNASCENGEIDEPEAEAIQRDGREVINQVLDIIGGVAPSKKVRVEGHRYLGANTKQTVSLLVDENDPVVRG